MRAGRPNPLTRALLGLIRGPGAEFLLGDLEESWQALRTGPGGRWRAEARHLRDVARSVVTWHVHANGRGGGPAAGSGTR